LILREARGRRHRRFLRSASNTPGLLSTGRVVVVCVGAESDAIRKGGRVAGRSHGYFPNLGNSTRLMHSHSWVQHKTLATYSCQQPPLAEAPRAERGSCHCADARKPNQ